MTYDLILVFKPQGSDCPGSELKISDFLFSFQTEFQRDLLTKYGNDIVCMDATHGTNVYDFQLITLLVVDAYGEGIPIGNREDTVLLTEFLS
jgi:hypothetical protein